MRYRPSEVTQQKGAAASARELHTTGRAGRAARIALSATAILATLTVWELAFRPAAIEPMPGLPAAILGGPARVAIVPSEVSARCLGSPGGYSEHAAHWQRLLRNAGYVTETIGDSELGGALDGYAAIILPSVVCLGDASRAGLQAFVRRGGGLIATWALGARDAKGEWRGFDFLSALTGVLRFEDGRSEAPWFVSLTTRSPLGAGLVGGGRIQITSAERMEAAALDADGFWSDARLLPRDPALPHDQQGAVIRQRLGAGRVVWLGFHENGATGGADRDRIEALLRNAAAWAARRPLVAVEPWPAPHSWAMLVAIDVGEHPESARVVAAALARARIPATYFLDPALAPGRELTPELAAAGELALKWRHLDGDGRPARHVLDRLRLESARFALWRSTSSWAYGVRPFGDMLDGGQRELLAEAGIRYHLAAGGVDSVLPSSLQVRRPPALFSTARSLVGLTRSSDDDLHLSPLGLLGLSPEWISRRLQDDGASVARLGGLYVLSLHTQGLAQPEYLPLLRASLAALGADGGWIAQAGKIADWWSTRNRVRVALSQASVDALRIEVSSEADRALENLGLTVFPGTMHAPRLLSSGATGQQPQVVVDPANGSLRLRLPRLEARRAVRMDLTFGR